MTAGRLTVLAAAVLTLAACSNSAPPAGLGADAPEGQLNIIAWPGYIERGASDKQYDWVTPFERNTGCKVNVTTVGTSDEMVALMTQGGYDLVIASGDATLRLVHGGTVQRIDLTRVKRFATLDARLREAPWHYVNGNITASPISGAPTS